MKKFWSRVFRELKIQRGYEDEKLLLFPGGR